MNTPGVKISSRLAKIGVGFIAFVILGVFVWPHLWSSKAAIPEVPPTHFAPPPSRIPTPSLRALMPPPVAQATPVPKAQPTPCQPCIEAANEVLQRYLHAIRDGAGADNREDRNTYGNIYEAPQVYPNTNHPIFVPSLPAVEQPHG
jgi:hypothetical protein